jgi:TRAP-type C4-dicarboxylate transport system permease large subunit
VLFAAVLGVAAGGAAAVGEVLPPEMQGAQHEGGWREKPGVCGCVLREET